MSRSNQEDQLAAKIEAMAAYVTSFTEGPETALSALRGKRDPDSVKRQLAILVEAARHSEAVQLLDTLPLDNAWADRATEALVLAGEFQRAKDVIAWSKAQGDPLTWNRCIFLYVHTSYRKTLKPYESDTIVRADALSAPEKEALADFVGVAQPIVRLVDAKDQVDNEMESIVLQYVAHAESLLNNKSSAQNLARLLLSRKPLPLIVARLMLTRTVRFDDSVIERLRSEHPGNFEALILAAIIEGELKGKHAEAFAAAVREVSPVLNGVQRRELCRVLLQLAQYGGLPLLTVAEEKTRVLLEPGDEFQLQVRATILLAEGKVAEAKVVLETIRGEHDPLWLQAYANVMSASGKMKDAADYLEAATKTLPHPELFRSLAMHAHQIGDFLQAKRALEQLQRILPTDFNTLRNLCIVYVQLEEWRSAASQFRRMHEIEPTNPWHQLNAANSLARAGDWNQSLQIYAELCGRPDAPLAAFTGMAGLLKTMGEPAQAFETLKQQSTRFWDSPDFVGAFLDISFQAGREEEGHQALLQLRRLQELGKASPDVLQEKSVDDMVAMLRHHSDNVEMLHRNLLLGKMPWLMCDALLGTASYLGWWMRTQELTWLAEAPTLRAQRCIYSTNSFTLMREDGVPQIAELSCCPPGTPVAIDLSALITLQRLDLLGLAVEYFGRLHYPSSYLTLRLYEADRIGIRQPSRKSAMEAIRRAVDANHIEIVNGIDSPDPLVNEHTLPEDRRHYYRLADVLPVLIQAGLVTQEDQRQFQAVAHKPSGAGGEHRPLSLWGTVRFDLSTLETIAQIRVLDPVLKVFKVQLSRDGYDRVVSELAGFSMQERLAKWNTELWTWIRQEPRVVQTLHKAPPEWQDYDVEGGREESLAAAFLSLQQQIPLLCDDRCSQMYVLNQKLEVAHAAFGTDCVINALLAKNMITADRAADAMLQLLSWRYRFLVCSPGVLLAMARRFKHNLPGEQLRRVSRYVHDSIRDPGMFLGFESSVPPTTMANRFYQAWLAVVSEATAQVWLDTDNFTPEAAAAFTKWAIQELIPSLPNVPPHSARVLAELTPRILFSRLVLKLCATDNYAVANKCIYQVGSNLGLTHEDIEACVLEVINDI